MMNTDEWTIPALLQQSGAYWATCALHTGVKLDIFTLLDGVARPTDDIATETHSDPRASAMLLNALTAIGLLEKRGNSYISTPFSSNALSQKSPENLGHIIMHHHHLMAGWSRLDEAVRSGSPVRTSVSHGDDESVRENFLMGMFNMANLTAPKIVPSINLSGCRTLLDLGGGPGTYSIHFCLANPQLNAVVYDLPTTRQFAERTIARFGLSDRISFDSGDYNLGDVPAGFDVAWLSHILHSDSSETCAALLHKATASLIPGGTLMIQEFILNDSKSGPPFPALFSLNMLIGTAAGQSYSESELSAMMTDAGLSEVERLNIDLPNGAGVMTGRKL